MNSLFDKVLIANRGEIAVRITRTLRRLGIRSVLAAVSEELDTPAAQAADEVVQLEGCDAVAAYLDADQMIRTAQAAGAGAIHPGYGFLAENADFAEAVTAAGLTFIGPSASVIRLMGDKINSQAFARQHGFSGATLEAEEDDPATFADRVRKFGFPLVIKAAAGGGGRGMQIVRSEAELTGALSLARSEAQRFFGDGRVYVERYIERSRHIEVQILADRHGNCIHVLERECSIQRRFQKLIEECPAPGLPPETRDALYQEAVGIARAAAYEGAGTIEFLFGPDGSFSFLEMNTRLQVEHPVTELVTGIDLVEQQLRVAAGERLSITQEDVSANGHAIECRVCAEDPENDFAPATGRVRRVRLPDPDYVRIDSGIDDGSQVTTLFDSMLMKLCAHGQDRMEAIDRMQSALINTAVLGVKTNTRYLAGVVDHQAFRHGELHTGFLREHADELRQVPDTDTIHAAVLAVALSDRSFLEAINAAPALHRAIGHWRN